MLKDVNDNCSISTATKTIDSLSFCDVCDIINAPQFCENPFCFIVEIDDTKKRIFLKDIPLSIRIGTKELSFICATLHVKNHFRSIFRLNDRFYSYDDLRNVKCFEKKLPSSYDLKTLFYYLT